MQVCIHWVPMYVKLSTFHLVHGYIVLERHVEDENFESTDLDFSKCNQPGLSARKRMAIQPPDGTPAVFLSTGSMRLKLEGSLFGS